MPASSNISTNVWIAARAKRRVRPELSTASLLNLRVHESNVTISGRFCRASHADLRIAAFCRIREGLRLLHVCCVSTSSLDCKLLPGDPAFCARWGSLNAKHSFRELTISFSFDGWTTLLKPLASGARVSHFLEDASLR